MYILSFSRTRQPSSICPQEKMWINLKMNKPCCKNVGKVKKNGILLKKHFHSAEAKQCSFNEKMVQNNNIVKTFQHKVQCMISFAYWTMFKNLRASTQFKRQAIPIQCTQRSNHSEISRPIFIPWFSMLHFSRPFSFFESLRVTLGPGYGGGTNDDVFYHAPWIAPNMTGWKKSWDFPCTLKSIPIIIFK